MTDRREHPGQKERTSRKYAIKKTSAQRLAVERAAQRRAARKRNILVVGGGAAAVLVVVAIIVGVSLGTSGSSKSKSSNGGNPVIPASSAVIDAVTNVPATENLDVTKLVAGPPKKISGSPLTGKDGVPQVLYVGAEFCPFCAATRWPLAVALGRFGTFSSLKTTYSSDTDQRPHTPTLSFYKSSYTSQYVDFVGVENEDGLRHPLEPLTAEQSKLFGGLSGSNYPFIDFGGAWTQSGSSYDPEELKGMTPSQVANAIGDPSSKVGMTIRAGADVFTAIICQLDGGKPGGVCTASGVQAANAVLNANSK